MAETHAAGSGTDTIHFSIGAVGTALVIYIKRRKLLRRMEEIQHRLGSLRSEELFIDERIGGTEDDIFYRMIITLLTDLERSLYKLVEKNIQLFRLKEIGRNIISSLDEKRLMDSVFDYLVQGVGYKETAIILLRRKRSQFQALVSIEKANRVVELMLSSVSAMELMAGKILGLGLAGLIQVMAWSAAIGFAASRFVPITLSAFSIVHFVAYPLYFTLGYLLIAAMYATVGAAMKDVHSGGAQGMVGIIPYLPMMFVAAVIEHPEQVWIRIASFFPPFTPSLMMMRLAITPVPWWEVVASLVLLGVSVYALMRFAARVFEAAMLMYGKSATLREIWRWGIRSSCRQVPFRNRAP